MRWLARDLELYAKIALVFVGTSYRLTQTTKTTVIGIGHGYCRGVDGHSITNSLS